MELENSPIAAVEHWKLSVSAKLGTEDLLMLLYQVEALEFVSKRISCPFSLSIGLQQKLKPSFN